MIRLVDMPGVPEVETRLELNDLVGVKATDHELNAMISEVLRTGFGLAGYSEWDWDWDFEIDDEDDVSFWKRAGWDVTDRNGLELRCTRVFDWAMALVASGEAGRPMLEIEADIWAKQQAARPPQKSPANDRYLQFGKSPARPGKRRA